MREQISQSHQTSQARRDAAWGTRLWCSEPSRFMLRALGIGFAVGAVLMVDTMRPERPGQRDRRGWATLGANVDEVRSLLALGLGVSDVRASLAAQGIEIPASVLDEYAACYASVRAAIARDAAEGERSDAVTVPAAGSLAAVST